MVRTILANLHLAAGFVALAAFWAPLFMKKGSRLHRLFGWVFVGAMAVILTSAATMTVARIMEGNRDFALFLGFLTLITFSALWNGATVMRHKNDPAWLRSRFQFGLQVVIIGAGAMLIWQWWETRFPLLLVFGLVGVLGIPELLEWRKPLVTEARWWWHHHLAMMIISGMAAHIAFFAFGSSRIWPDLYDGQPWWLMLLPWVAPFPIAFGAIALLQRHYRQRFSRLSTNA